MLANYPMTWDAAEGDDWQDYLVAPIIGLDEACVIRCEGADPYMDPAAQTLRAWVEHEVPHLTCATVVGDPASPCAQFVGIAVVFRDAKTAEEVRAGAWPWYRTAASGS